MTTLSEHPRQQLQIIIARFGHSICDNPKRCEAILRDLCPENKREVNLLVTALKEKIVYDLLNRPSLMPLEATLKSLSLRLQDNHGTAEAFADWAVESWALSLSVMQKPLHQTAVKTSSPKFITPPQPTQKYIGKYIVQDGIATDTQTALMWCRFAYGQMWHNNTVVGNAQKIDWKTAFEVVTVFNKKGGYAGFTDWRLPTLDELKTLIDKEKGKNGNWIDTDIFSNSVHSVWSSSYSYSHHNSNAYFMDFYNGNDTYDNKNAYYAIRLVRGKYDPVPF